MKKIILFCFFIICGCLFFNSPTFAATRYVSTLGTDDVSHGSSSGAGAWKTMQYAHSQAANGDTIYVAAGTYVEIGSGAYGGLYMSPAKGITWIAQGEVIIQPDATSTTAFVYIATSAQNISFTGFTFDFGTGGAGPIYFHDTGTGTYSFNNCNFLSTTSTKMLRSLLGSGPVTISNSTINCSGSTSTVSCIDNYGDMTISSSTINVYAAKNLSMNRVPNLINNNINIGIADDVFNISKTHTFNMTGNTFTVTSSVANLFYLESPTITGTYNIQNNTFSGNTTFSEAFAYLGSNNGIALDISNNTFDFPNARSTYLWSIFATATTTISGNTFNVASTSNSTPIMIKGYKRVNSLQILNNTFNMHSATSYMIAVGPDADNDINSPNNNLDGAIIRGNKLLGISYWDRTAGLSQATHAILVGYSINATIENNFIAGAGYGMVLKGNGMQYTSGGVRNNILYNNVAAGGLSKGMGGVKYYNNTIYYDLNDASKGIDIAKNLDPELSPNTKVKNNIFYGNSFLDPISIDTANNDVTFESDSNLFYLTSGTASELNNSKYNLNSIGSDPQFVSTSTINLYLQNTSPAIGAGLNLSSEYTGGLSKNTTFPNPSTTTRTTWDLGAYTYSDGITLSSNSLNINEGASTTYTIVLKSQPTNDVVISLSPDSKSLVSSSTLTFTNSNWNTPQTIIVTTVNDSIYTSDTYNSTISYSVSSSDSSYNNITVSNTNITITEDDPSDSTSPTSSILINSGNVSTNSTSVTLTLGAEDNISATSSLQMMISNYNDFNDTDWESYTTSKSWTLLGTTGTNTVYFKVKDGAGNISSTSTDTIVFDTTIPTGSIMINNNNTPTNVTSVALTISANDNFSTTSSMQMIISNNSSFNNASWEDYTISKSWIILGITSGLKTVYVKFKDEAGNESNTYSDIISYITYSKGGNNLIDITKETTPTITTTRPIIIPEIITPSEKLRLFKYLNDPKVYILENGIKRLIKDEYTFNKLGYNWNDIQVINENTTFYSTGDDLILISPENSFIFTKTLKPRSIGTDVKELQTLLKRLGFFTYPKITNFFGTQTYNAVIKFQKANKLKVTGIVDDNTRSVLNKQIN